MRASLIILSLSAACVLAGCQPAAPVHDKAYFAGHAQERGQTLAACRNDPGGIGGTPNCVNALLADADAEHERVFHSPPPPAPGVNNSAHL
jgi:hypothetical protein